MKFDSLSTFGQLNDVCRAPYEAPIDDPMNDPMNEEPREDDSEARSVFVSQLAARLTARDLGYFFEDKLGENTVLDARIVTDRLSRRSKGSATLVCVMSQSRY